MPMARGSQENARTHHRSPYDNVLSCLASSCDVYVPYQKAPRAVNAYRAIKARTAVGALVWSLITSSSMASQIWSIRDQLKILQGWDNQDLPLLRDGSE